MGVMKPIWVLSLLVSGLALAGSPKTVSNESEEEAMITEMEQLGKTIQEALAKIQAQFKGGSPMANSGEAKRNLEQLARDLESKKGQMKSSGGRAPRAVGSVDNMKMLQEFMKGLTSKVMDNVNQTVDKLNKISDETP